MVSIYDEVGGIDNVRKGSIYGDEAPEWRNPGTLLFRDKVIVQPMKPVETAYGVDVIPDGDPVYCWCSVEGRIQKSSTFSKNWAQDNLTGSQLGLSETTMLRMLAPEWHGSFYSRIWHEGSCYEIDGSPVEMPTSTEMARHWQIMLRRVVNADFNPGVSVPVVPEGSPVWGTSV